MKNWKKQGKIIWGRIILDIKKFWGIIAAFLLYDLVTHMIFHQFCPMVIITGIPCAGCGMTRAFFYLLTGHPQRAMTYNAGVIIWGIAIGYALAGRYLIGKKLKGTKAMFVIAFIFSLLYYVYRMLNFPTGVQPMIYEENNILQHFIPFYDQILHIIFRM